VTVTPATATVQRTNKQTFNAQVSIAGGAAKTVSWSVDSTKSTVSSMGVLTVAGDEDKLTCASTREAIQSAFLGYCMAGYGGREHSPRPTNVSF